MNPRKKNENKKRPREDWIPPSENTGTVQNRPSNPSLDTDPIIDLTQPYILLPNENWGRPTTDSPPVRRRRLNNQVTEDNSVIVINDSPATAPSRRNNRRSVRKPARRDNNQRIEDTATNSNQDVIISFFGDCPICFEPMGKNPLASTKCGHVFCFDCIEQAIKVTKKCPTCRKCLNKTGYHRLYFSDN